MPIKAISTPLSPRQIAIINLLPVGDKVPIPTRTIASLLNTTLRIVRQDINALITQHGVPIGSKREGNAGYYLIENNEQRKNTLLPLYAQMQSENKRIEALETIDIVAFYEKKKAGAFTE
ncbi:hypothetical protein ACNQ2Q_26010 [Enterobacter cloacae complex sp.6701430]|uniref:hypothetical protein n=1 Tax=Enterobacter cloacae complex sp.6701430 TaxID=3397176 RepID=UPI003AAC043A